MWGASQATRWWFFTPRSCMNVILEAFQSSDRILIKFNVNKWHCTTRTLLSPSTSNESGFDISTRYLSATWMQWDMPLRIFLPSAFHSHRWSWSSSLKSPFVFGGIGMACSPLSSLFQPIRHSISVLNTALQVDSQKCQRGKVLFSIQEVLNSPKFPQLDWNVLLH